MNLEIVIKTNKDGRVVLSCPRLAGCEVEGASIEEATNKLIDLIAESISSDIKKNLKLIFSEALKKLPADLPPDSSTVLTNFPVSLN